MKILFISTDSDYHRYYINRVNEHFEIVAVVYETYKLQHKFERIYPFRNQEEQYDQKFWVDGIQPELPPDLPVYYINRVIDDDFPKILEKVGDVDVAVVGGSSKIYPHVIEYFRLGMINIHRGIAQKYRGLDSEYWAIYHEDYQNIGVTIHYIDKGLDTGDVILQRSIKIDSASKIFHIKYLTCTMGMDLMVEALTQLRDGTIKP